VCSGQGGPRLRHFGCGGAGRRWWNTLKEGDYFSDCQNVNERYIGAVVENLNHGPDINCY
jgi:hypothetical protein